MKGMGVFMREFNSCMAAMKSCITRQYFAIAHLYNDEKPMNMHIHDCYEIYFSISGGKQFLIDNHFYKIQPGDIFFINQYESHHLTQIDQEIHERIVLSISPAYLTSVSSQLTDLNQCFSCINKKNHKLSLNPENQKRFIYFIHKICSTDGFGEDLIEQSAFLELMVFLNRLYHHMEQEQTAIKEMSPYHQQVDHILAYINNHIQNPLTIQELSGHFFLSESYLCRIFKEATGTTINKYITAKRISIAKSILSQGHTVSEACEFCGFRDYSNFLKAFTKAVGISPKKYAKFVS
jgi:AraC-type DNA-binding domain-containing proteins